MKKQQLTYRTISLLLLLAMLPSVLGVHVFHHHCGGCNENETIARMLTTIHSHAHNCVDCTCHAQCQSCEEALGHTQDEHNNACQHDFKRATLEGKIAALKFKFQAETILLLYNSCFQSVLIDKEFKPQKDFCNVILNIPDEPSSEKNCVFLL